MNKKDLIDFERDIFDTYEAGKIRGVIHLSGGGEQELLKIFKKVKKRDWVFSGHRNHYHTVLKAGRRFCKRNIMEGNSMHQYSKKHKVFTSGIVCGSVPIALGVALSLKLKKEKGHVWCFIGDMASQMGSFMVCVKYAQGHQLPITFIIEDNGVAVYTPTRQSWGICGSSRIPHSKKIRIICGTGKSRVIDYKYKRKYPHHGTGKFIHF